jgi:hypothetical protein
MDAHYEYMLDWSKGSKRRHVHGERSFIERYIRRDKFEALFGGEMLLTDPSGKSEFIGVWVITRTPRAQPLPALSLPSGRGLGRDSPLQHHAPRVSGQAA